jgi:hypothetical protein
MRAEADQTIEAFRDRKKAEEWLWSWRAHARKTFDSDRQKTRSRERVFFVSGVVTGSLLLYLV